MPTVSIIYCLLASGFCVYSCIIPVKPAIAKVRRIFCVSVFNLYFLSLAAYFAALAPLCVSLSVSGPGLPDYTVYKIGYKASANGNVTETDNMYSIKCIDKKAADVSLRMRDGELFNYN